MNKFLQDVKDFHEKFEITYNGKPRALPGDIRRFRENFSQEELNEYTDAGHDLALILNEQPIDQAEITVHLEKQLDALVDSMYITLGNAYLHGFLPKFQEAWDRVHAANMAKVRAAPDASNSKRGSSFDVVKPPGWTAPSHTDLVEDHAHAE